MYKFRMPKVAGMEVKSEQLNSCTILLRVRCSPEQVRSGFERAYKRVAKRLRIPGFRPGAAPRGLVRQYADPEYVKELAQEEILNAVYPVVVEQEGLEPYGRPMLQAIQADEASGSCEFALKVPLRPKISLGEPEQVCLERPSGEVSDEEVEQHIEALRRRLSERRPVEGRGAEPGDYAVVHLIPEGDESRRKRFLTVVGETFPQLDRELIGMKPGEVKSTTLTFPQDFQETDWAGGLFSCEIRLESLMSQELPALDDEFAKRWDAGSLAELRVKVREDVRGIKAEAIERYLEEQALERYVDLCQVEMPDTMWERLAGERLRSIIEDASRRNGTLGDVARANNMTEAQLREAVALEARRDAARALVVGELFRREGMSISREDEAEEVARVAAQAGVSWEQAWEAVVRGGGQDDIRYRIMARKVMKYLRERARVQEETKEHEKDG